MLNFDDPSTDEQEPSGIAATAVLASAPAAASLLSSNPLDDLVSIFGNVGIASTPAPPAQHNAFAGLSLGAPALSPAPPVTPTVFQASSPAPTQAQSQPQDDLLGLF